MYAGSTLKRMRLIDTWFGAHQKIDRLAHRHLTQHLRAERLTFPSIKTILEFEGVGGPDAIKRKTPSQDEPRHFFDPTDKKDTGLLHIIEEHYQNLVTALVAGQKSRAAFEAAWLAHAVVDGLTPAHHYPYEEELTRLHGGVSVDNFVTPKGRIVMAGDTLRSRARNNWQMWGDKGLLTTHLAFEWGVNIVILPMRLRGLQIPDEAFHEVRRQKPSATFQAAAFAIADLELYQQFYKAGWTPRLAKQIRKDLLPRIVQTVALVWYRAAAEAATKRQIPAKDKP